MTDMSAERQAMYEHANMLMFEQDIIRTTKGLAKRMGFPSAVESLNLMTETLEAQVHKIWAEADAMRGENAPLSEG